MRATLLEVVHEYANSTADHLQQGSILGDVARRLGIGGNTDLEQALLTLWHELFRNGMLAWGYNISNPNPPFLHLTEKGHEVLKTIGRDPVNPDGYLAYLLAHANLDPIALSYIDEALKTYNSNCIKATAVMLGCAAESIALALRDTLVAKMLALGKPVPVNLNDWRIRTVLTAMSGVIDADKKSMDRQLREAYESYWPAFTQQIRAARNDAGHPSDVDPVSDFTVHSGLLIFPELASLARDIEAWIAGTYA